MMRSLSLQHRLVPGGGVGKGNCHKGLGGGGWGGGVKAVKGLVCLWRVEGLTTRVPCCETRYGQFSKLGSLFGSFLQGCRTLWVTEERNLI